MPSVKKDEVCIYHQPNWHPKLQALLGDIRGQYGYVTKYDTIELLGPLYENPNIKDTTYSTEDNGPTLLFTAASAF
jgi:hypothetical protein